MRLCFTEEPNVSVVLIEVYRFELGFFLAGIFTVIFLNEEKYQHTFCVVNKLL